jgi:hypothetical protein
VDRLFGNRTWYALVDGIDRPTHRLTAEQQNRRAAQHLDPFGGERFYGDGMVGRGVRSVDIADAVGENGNAIALETAQHRARRSGGEAGCRDAGKREQGIANLPARLLRQILARQGGGAREQIEPLEIGCGDDDFAGAVKIVVGSVGVCLLLRNCGGSREGEGKQGGGCTGGETHLHWKSCCKFGCLLDEMI